MPLEKVTPEQLLSRYQFLCKACQPDRSIDPHLNAEIAQLEALIQTDLVNLTHQGCPSDITDILDNFNHELARFRAFCEFPDLATKSVVGIGGGFSAGKSSFINKLIGQKCLVAEVDPTTSMPAYVMKGEADSIQALNTNNCAIKLTQDEFSSLTHEEKLIYGSQIGRLLQSAFITLSDFTWQNLAILDTPGYSKPEDQNCSERTDENLSRAQLNSVNYIIWVVSAESGVISENDIAFLSSLNRDIPKLVLVSRADKRTEEDIPNIVELIRTTLLNQGISILDVVPFSTRKRSSYSLEPIIEQLNQWNSNQNTLPFSKNFKRLFLSYQRFIEEEQRSAIRSLQKLNRILALSNDEDINQEIEYLLIVVRKSVEKLTRLQDDLSSLNHVFFTKLKEIGDLASVNLPEPSELEFVIFQEGRLLNLLQNVREDFGIEEIQYSPFEHLHMMDAARARILRRAIPTSNHELNALEANSTLLTNVQKSRVVFEESHFMARKDIANNVRDEYAILLAAIISGSGCIIEDQNQLFNWLLKSMSAKYDIAYYYHQSQKLDEKTVTAFINKYSGSEIAEALFFDSVILLKIANDSTNLINELYRLLNVMNSEVNIYLEAMITNDFNEVKSLSTITVELSEIQEMEILDTNSSAESDVFVKCKLKQISYKDKPLNSNAKNYNKNTVITRKSQKEIQVTCLYEGIFCDSIFGFPRTTEKKIIMDVLPIYYLELPKTLSAWRSLFQSALEESKNESI